MGVAHGTGRSLSRVVLIGTLALVVVTVGACAASPTGQAPTPTAPPSPTSPPAPPTATPRPGVQPLPIPAPLGVLPSPDGTIIAVPDDRSTSVALYSLSGQNLGAYNTPHGQQGLFQAWLPDSSGLLIWREDPVTGLPGPILILDRQGQVHSTGLTGVDPLLSPDGQWVAAEYVGTYVSQSTVVVAPRAGGTARTLARGGARFLGWQGSRVLYFLSGSVYAIAPTGGSAAFVAAAPSGAYLDQPSVGPFTSPDGQVLVVSNGNKPPYEIFGTHLQRLPPATYSFTFWAGPHAVLGTTRQGDLLVIDIETGATLRDTHLTPQSGIMAVSGDWIAGDGASANGDQELHVINLETRADHDLGDALALRPIVALTGGRFVVSGQGQTYLIDPSLAS